MAVPVVASVSTAATGTGTSISTNAPSGVSSGDLLVLCVNVSTATTISTPTGWTQITTASNANTRASMFYRIADGGSDDTPTVSLGASKNYVGVILRITGAVSSPLETFGSGTDDSQLSNPAVPAVSTSASDELLIAMIAVDGPSGYFVGTPSGWTQQALAGSAGVCIYSKSAATSGTYGGQTATLFSPATTSKITAAFASTAVPQTFSRSFSENVAATDTPLRSASNFRTASEKLGLYDVQIYKPNYKTFAHESLGLTDTPVVIPTWRRALIEMLASRDSMTRTTPTFRQLSENLAMTDTATRAVLVYRQITDLLALRDILGDIQTSGPGGTTWHRTLSESLGMLEAIKRSTLYSRQLSENLAMVEAITRSATYKRQLAENMALQEQIGRALIAMRRIAESMGFSDIAALTTHSSTPSTTSRRFYRPGSTVTPDTRAARTVVEDTRVGKPDDQVQ